MRKNKFVYLVFLTSFVSLISLIGCQQEEAFDEVYDNGKYLSLPGNVDYDQLTGEDSQTLFQAFSRLELRKTKDGLYELAQKRGKDVNISEDLFNYFWSIVQHTNERILSDVDFNRNRVLTRQEGGGSATDCVAQTIAYATGQNYNDVNSWITGKYGDRGVPADDFYSVMGHFAGGEQVSFSSFNNMDIPDSKNYIIVLNNSHAVTVRLKSGNSIIYWDAQNNRPGFCTTSDVTHIYKLR